MVKFYTKMKFSVNFMGIVSLIEQRTYKCLRR